MQVILLCDANAVFLNPHVKPHFYPNYFSGTQTDGPFVSKMDALNLPFSSNTDSEEESDPRGGQ